MKTHTCNSRNGPQYLSWFCLLFLALFPALAIAAGPLLPSVSRFSSFGASSFKEESGSLYRNGQYKALRTLTSSLSAEEREELQAIDGRPVMSVDQFYLYQSAGQIPSWVTSSVQSYPFLFNDFVILSVKGGPDPNPPPVFFEQPQSQTVPTGQRFTLLAMADPFDLVTYQWFKNGKPIPSETDALLIVEDPKKSDRGNYTLRANLGSATAVSEIAKITIFERPTFRRNLKDMTVQKGKPATLRVLASGTGPITYQWFKSGQPVPNAKGPRLSLKSVTEADAGFYFVRVRSPYSVLDSAFMTLVVTQ